MKNFIYFKYIFSLFFLLFSQQILAGGTTGMCAQRLQACVDSGREGCYVRDVTTGWYSDYDSLVNGLVEPNFAWCTKECPPPFQGISSHGDMSSCPVSCPSGQVPVESGTGCTFPPNPNPVPTDPSPTLPHYCTAPQVLVPISGNCEIPVVCVAPQVRNENANICVSPSPASCDIASAACATAITGHPEMSCSVDVARAISCMSSTLNSRVICTPCGGGDPYEADASGNPLTGTGTTGTSTGTGSGDPILDAAKADCAAKGGTWAAGADIVTATTTQKTGTCTTATGTTTTGGTVKSNTTQPKELNCGGTTGIACESTQLSSLSKLTDIAKFLGFDATKPLFDQTKLQQIQKDIADLTPKVLTLDDVPEVKAFFGLISKVTMTGCYGVKFMPDHTMGLDFTEFNKVTCDFIAVIRAFVVATTLMQVAVFIARN